MFSSPVQFDRSLDEGSVTEVDVIRRICKVKTISGQNLNNVKWMKPNGGASRAGDRSTPSLNDTVIIHTGLGYPLIIGFLDRVESNEGVFPVNIDTGGPLVDTGNFSDSGKNVLPDQNGPTDLVNGDRVISSNGGGLFAILRGGSILLRSSRMSEIFMSKWNDLVRIVSRNWEHFTDVSSDMARNIQGRVYRYTGYAATQKDAKVEDYKFHQYVGDVAVAEAVKTHYQTAGALPVATDVIYKEQVTTGSGGAATEVLHREIHLDGKHDLVITDGINFTRIRNTSGLVEITYNDTNVVTIDQDKIRLAKGGDSISVVISGSNIVSTYNGAVNTLDSNGIKSSFSGGEVTIDSNGVSSIKGGHFVKVTSSGVAFG